MVLSDRTIREYLDAGKIGIFPLGYDCIQPASIDLHLSTDFRVFRNSRQPYIDVRQSQEKMTELLRFESDDPFVLHPGEFALGSTVEKVTIPNSLIARLEGKSSLGRCGLMIHSTAGYIDPGFHGQITLELSNVANLPIMLYPWMRIAQLSFLTMTTPADVPYGSPSLGSKYQGQRGPQASKIHREFEGVK